MRIRAAAALSGTAMLAVMLPTVAGAAMQNGDYECWYFSSPRLTFNFAVVGADSYTGYDGTPGRYRHDTATSRVEFTSGTLAGAMDTGYYAIYEVRHGIPTLAYMSNSSGAEVLFCQNT